MDNNIIVKIQGLEGLVNLRWLDLSFNLIEKIEGLDNNKQLEDLSLYSNCVTELSGLEELNKLNVLSVGRNKIGKLEPMLLYLKKLRNNLQVLKIEDNDFQKDEKSNKDSAYRLKTIAWFKDLKYLDYKIITDEERKNAQSEQEKSQENQEPEEKSKEDLEENSEEMQKLREAHIEVTYKLIENILSRCDEYEKLRGFKKLNELK